MTLSTIGTILLTLFMFGILITIHEFGHYIVARLFNVGIIEFSIGMGPKILSWEGKKNTFTLRLLPIGGYVNMVGEYASDGEEKSDSAKDDVKDSNLSETSSDDTKKSEKESEEASPNVEGKASFSDKPIWQRLLVVLAGPFMNIVFGIIIMFAIVLCSCYTKDGSQIYSSKIGRFNNEVAIQENYSITQTGYGTSGNNMLYISMTGNTDEKGFIEGDIIIKTSDVPMSEEKPEEKYTSLFYANDITVEQAAAKFGTPKYARVMRKNLIVDIENPVLPDASGLAISGRLILGDEILEVEGKNVNIYTDLSYQISRYGIEPVSVLVKRNNEKVLVEDVIFPMCSNKAVLFGEVDFQVYAKKESFGNIISEAFFRSISTVKMTVSSVVDTFSGRYGVEALSGPIGIGEQVGDMVESDFPIMNLLTLMVLVSLSLGICNLLPLPVLDGGRVLLFIIEAIRRKPLNPKVESAIMAISMAFVLVLMVLVAFKDIIGLF